MSRTKSYSENVLRSAARDLMSIEKAKLASAERLREIAALIRDKIEEHLRKLEAEFGA